MEREEEEEAACRKANPKEHYPPRLGARCLALPLASLREEFVGWGTVRGLGTKRRDQEAERQKISLPDSLAQPGRSSHAPAPVCLRDSVVNP